MSKSEKILYVHHTAVNGGATMSLFYLLEYVKQKYEVVVYFIEDGPAVEFYQEAGINCVIDNALGKLPHCTIENQSLNPFCFKFYHDIKSYSKRYLSLLPTYFRMRQIIANEKPDIVHLNSSVLIAEGLAVKSTDIPLVWHMRDFLDYGNFRLRYNLLRGIISRCSNIVIGLCESEINRISAGDKGVVIPNFVNFDKFDYQKFDNVNLRGQLGVASGTKIIAILGWNTPAKGAQILMQAFAEISAKHPDTMLVFFGEGQRQVTKSKIKNILRFLTGKKNIRAELQKIIDKFSLQNRVFFPGVIFDIASYIAEVDIIAAPFTQPHFARPILEAGAMKTLVITSDIDGTREMVLQGKAGYLAKPGDKQDWAQQLDLALSSDNHDKIELMFNNTQHTYNSDINANNTIEVYRDILTSSLHL